MPRHFRTGKVRTVKWAATAGADEVADGAVDGAAGQPKAADGVGGADSGAAVEEGREVKRRRVEGDGGAGEGEARLSLPVFELSLAVFGDLGGDFGVPLGDNWRPWE